MKRFAALLLLCALTACSAPSQSGGGDVCPCATARIVTATMQQPSPTVTITPIDGTATVIAPTYAAATPTKVPILPSQTPNPTDCPGYPIAAQRKGFEYRYLDRDNSGIWQRIRIGPGTNYAIVGYLKPMLRKPVFWTFGGWESISPDCRQWVANHLGELVDSWTE